MTEVTALLDANVLYSAPIRDIFLQLARDNLFQVRWTKAIQDEWTNALLKRSRHINQEALRRTLNKMDEAFRDAVLSGYEHLVDELNLPDPDDRHVLAAAVSGRCTVLVTQNLKHFPAVSLERFPIKVQLPDDFMLEMLLKNPVRFCSSVRTILARLRNPQYSVEEYLANLKQAGLSKTACELEPYASLLI